MRIYQIRPEVWNEATCLAKASHRHKDGMGSPYPFDGYIGGFNVHTGGYGTIQYNGGCIRDGQHWDGENRPFPIILNIFEIIQISSWGYRIKKRD